MKPLRLSIFGLCFALLAATARDNPPETPAGKPPQVTLYDADPQHLWNRLYATIFLRVDAAGHRFGPDDLDLLFWTETTHLLAEPSYGQAIRVLDEFLTSHGEKLVPDPAKRAVLQRDLWAVFDWATLMGNFDPDADRKEKLRQLRTHLAAACKRLALSREQIAALPDNYAAAVAAKRFAPAPDPTNPDAPFLPPDLFDPDGPWVCLGNADGEALAREHVSGSDGRSAFFAFLHLPGGRAATVAYLDKIKAIDRPWVPDPSPPVSGRRRDPHPIMPNPDTPQIPEGTLVALVRRTLLIDDKTELAASPLTEEVRLRAYRKIARNPPYPAKNDTQSFQEFILDRRDFFGDPARGLHPRRAEERSFTFGPQIRLVGKDPFDSAEPVKPYGTVMASCVMCHGLPGVYSINSIEDLFGNRTLESLRTLGVSSPAAETAKARHFKEGYYFDRFKTSAEPGPGQAE